MTNNDIRILLNTVANKDREGLVPYDKLTQLLESEGINYFSALLEKSDYDWESRKALEPFLVEETDLSGSGSFPFSLLSGTVAKIVEARSVDNNPIEVIENTGIWYERINSYIKRPTRKNPIMRLKHKSIEILPVSIKVPGFLQDIIYYKYPTAPYLDGYLDANLKFNYLAEGGSVDLDSCESCVTLSGETEGEYSSQTVEMEFYDIDKIKIAGGILTALGIRYDKETLFGYAQLNK
jgi:hypothetical protein